MTEKTAEELSAQLADLQIEHERLREEWALLYTGLIQQDSSVIQQVTAYILEFRTLPAPDSIVADELEANEKRRDLLEIQKEVSDRAAKSDQELIENIKAQNPHFKAGEVRKAGTFTAIPFEPRDKEF